MITPDNFTIVTFPIDALDKMAFPGERSRANALTPRELLDKLLQLARRKINQCRIRVLVSSQREADDVERVFADNWAGLKLHKIEVDQEAPDNLQHFVEHVVANWGTADFLPSRSSDQRQEAMDKVVTEVTGGAGKMYTQFLSLFLLSYPGATIKQTNNHALPYSRRYLWAILTLNRIRNNRDLRTAGDVTAELNTLQPPKDIFESYGKIFTNLQRNSAKGLPSSIAAARAMLMLFCARKRLATHVILEAVSSWLTSVREEKGKDTYQPTVRDIVQCSGGLVVEDRDDDVFVFFHPSVEQYLESQPGCVCLSQTLPWSLLACRISATFRSRSRLDGSEGGTETPRHPPIAH